MVWVAVIAALSIALLAVCLAAPLVITARAPDDGDLVTVRVRHPAVSLDVWLPGDVVLHWLAGIPEPPPVAGEIAGIPVPRRALAPLARAAAGRAADLLTGRRPPPDEERAPASAEKAPGSDRPRGWFAAVKRRLGAAAPGAAWRERARLVHVFRIERCEVDLDYGTGDPVTTGTISGYLWQLASVLPEPCVIRARAFWVEPKLRVEGEARILIFPWRACVAVLCLGFAVAKAAWKAGPAPPDDKETDSWPIRTGTEAPAAVAPPSSPS